MALDLPPPIGAIRDQLKGIWASIRAKPERPFRVLKRHFRYAGVRSKGVARSAAQVTALFTLSNPFQARAESWITG